MTLNVINFFKLEMNMSRMTKLNKAKSLIDEILLQTRQRVLLR